MASEWLGWRVENTLVIGLLGKSESELAMTAHVAEVENRTGLGDVCSQYHGGCLVKLKEGYPLDAEQLPVHTQHIRSHHTQRI